MGSYKACYGDWAGNPKGVPPDRSRCAAEVYSGRSYVASQCRKSKTVGDFCRQHDPATIEERRKASNERYLERARERTRRDLLGADLVLKKIALGHNDARGLAQEWLDKMEGKI